MKYQPLHQPSSLIPLVVSLKISYAIKAQTYSKSTCEKLFPLSKPQVPLGDTCPLPLTNE